MRTRTNGGVSCPLQRVNFDSEPSCLFLISCDNGSGCSSQELDGVYTKGLRWSLANFSSPATDALFGSVKERNSGESTFRNAAASKISPGAMVPALFVSPTKMR